jgi:RNA polymerase sigma-70 factor, ECF subfamily
LPGSERSRPAADVEKWIVAAHKGNQEALGGLLEMCRRYLLLLANHELKPALWAKIAPSDIVQETLLIAGRDFPRFQGASEAELLNWLHGILHNNVANVHRHFETEKRQVSREVPLAGLPPAKIPPGEEGTPSGWARAREQDEQLENAMQQLPEHYRQVLCMHTTDGLSFVQIADKLSSTADAVRKLFGRAVEALANHLETPHESA